MNIDVIATYRWSFGGSISRSPETSRYSELVLSGGGGGRAGTIYGARVYLVRETAKVDPDPANYDSLLQREVYDIDRLLVGAVSDEDAKRTLANCSAVYGKDLAYRLIWKTLRENWRAVTAYDHAWLTASIADHLRMYPLDKDLTEHQISDADIDAIVTSLTAVAGDKRRSEKTRSQMIDIAHRLTAAT